MIVLSDHRFCKYSVGYFIGPSPLKLWMVKMCHFPCDLSRLFLYRIMTFYARLSSCMSRPAAGAAVP